MPALKFLDLSHTLLVSLPNSVSGLKNLTVLLLAYCIYLEKLPSFSKLKALVDLNLSGTNIKCLPDGMNTLVNLKNLDMDNIKNLRKLPNGIIPNLSSLQHLCVGETLVEGQVSGLRKLEYFSGGFCNVEELNKYVEAADEGHQRYDICVGQEPSNQGKGQEIIGLRFHLIFNNWIDVYKCRKLKRLLSFDVLKELHSLQGINVSYCEAMEEIIASDSEEGTVRIVMVCHSLQEIHIKECPKLKSIPQHSDPRKTIPHWYNIWQPRPRFADLHDTSDMEAVLEMRKAELEMRKAEIEMRIEEREMLKRKNHLLDEEVAKLELVEDFYEKFMINEGTAPSFDEAIMNDIHTMLNSGESLEAIMNAIHTKLNSGEGSSCSKGGYANDDGKNKNEKNF
ncbi:hypothetical protein V6N12_054609 [Hibiscus sabdariffa]|uniref:Disease resistance protein At4g27190-like leucine-rich repeats domain-containing protein n=1 Tax=Hibiscus sabdariffa TaxID=183260 RepID=A0ABR2D3R4_9ROSI